VRSALLRADRITDTRGTAHGQAVRGGGGPGGVAGGRPESMYSLRVGGHVLRIRGPHADADAVGTRLLGRRGGGRGNAAAGGDRIPDFRRQEGWCEFGRSGV
jgi:hypothetical protein